MVGPREQRRSELVGATAQQDDTGLGTVAENKRTRSMVVLKYPFHL